MGDFAPNQLVVGTVETVEVYLNYSNLAEPAFGPRINFTLPSTSDFSNLRVRIDNQVRLLYTGGILGIYWVMYWDILEYTGIYWGILRCTGIYWDVLGYTGMYWDILGCTGIY